jgi:tRNA pseudouridine55 synthase
VSDAGIVVLDKPGGMTSHDVVARVRRILGTRRVGHAGTLDPMATGVLVIGVGRATRLLGYLAATDKDYTATMRLGSATSTDDAEGDIVAVADATVLAGVTDERIRAAVAGLVGTIEQRPSSVSAIKVDGRRAHARVRAGEEVDLAPRRVRVDRLDVTAIRRTPDAVDLDVEVTCSTGTYVRALARDLGEQLGVGGHLTALRRTRVGSFDAPAALADLEAGGAALLLPMGRVAAAEFPVWTVDEESAGDVRQGRRIAWSGPDTDDPVAVLGEDGSLLALARRDAGSARYLAVLA